MSKWIDADALYEYITNHFGGVDCSILLDDEIAPSIDIVRCKECKHYTEAKGCLLEDNSTRQADDFCSYGERREP